MIVKTLLNRAALQTVVSGPLLYLMDAFRQRLQVLLSLYELLMELLRDGSLLLQLLLQCLRQTDRTFVSQSTLERLRSTHAALPHGLLVWESLEGLGRCVECSVQKYMANKTSGLAVKARSLLREASTALMSQSVG